LPNYKKILFIENDFISVNAIKEIFFANNLYFDLACISSEAHEMLTANSYDIILLSNLDCRGEKISATDVVKKITEKKIPVLVLLHYYNNNKQIIGFEKCDYLKTPFTEKAFLKKIKKLIDS
jgi:DNA-binding response OmpR family regulator